MQLHYVDFSACGEDASFTLARLMAAVHGYDAKATAPERLAVAYPAMREATVDNRGAQLTPPASGEVLRVFGRPESLTLFIASGTPLKLVRMGAATRTTQALVPAGATQTRFVRDRGFEKGFKAGSYARRQMRRAEEQGREYVPRASVGRVSRGFGLEAKSQSSENPFFLDIRNEPAENCELLRDITAYGLCGPGSSVPVF